MSSHWPPCSRCGVGPDAPYEIQGGKCIQCWKEIAEDATALLKELAPGINELMCYDLGFYVRALPKHFATRVDAFIIANKPETPADQVDRFGYNPTIE